MRSADIRAYPYDPARWKNLTVDEFTPNDVYGVFNCAITILICGTDHFAAAENCGIKLNVLRDLIGRNKNLWWNIFDCRMSDRYTHLRTMVHEELRRIMHQGSDDKIRMVAGSRLMQSIEQDKRIELDRRKVRLAERKLRMENRRLDLQEQKFMYFKQRNECPQCAAQSARSAPKNKSADPHTVYVPTPSPKTKPATQPESAPVTVVEKGPGSLNPAPASTVATAGTVLPVVGAGGDPIGGTRAQAMATPAGDLQSTQMAAQ